MKRQFKILWARIRCWAWCLVHFDCEFSGWDENGRLVLLATFNHKGDGFSNIFFCEHDKQKFLESLEASKQ